MKETVIRTHLALCLGVVELDHALRDVDADALAHAVPESLHAGKQASSAMLIDNQKGRHVRTLDRSPVPQA